MSLLENGAEGEANDQSNNNQTTETEDKSVDSLNKDFQNSTGQEGENNSETTAKTGNDASWFYADDLPGEGERPEFLQEKYKSVADQAKAYNELSKKFGSFKGAPEEYDTSIPEMPDFKFEEGDPVLDEFLNMAKESNASQDFVTKALQQYVKAQQFYAPDPQEEMQKLGSNAQQEIKAVTDWAGQKLDQNEMQVLKDMITTADSFRVIQKIRRAVTGQPEIAAVKSTQHEPKVNEREILEKIGSEKYNTDPLYREEVDLQAAKLWG